MNSSDSLHHRPIRNLQIMLQALSKYKEDYLPVVPSGIYSPDTTAAVASFQRLHGIPETGITDQRTWDSIALEYEQADVLSSPPFPPEICFPHNECMQKGCHGSGVQIMQSMLAEISRKHKCICCPECSGNYDDLSETSILDFQRLCCLPVTGILDKITWKHLCLQYAAASEAQMDMK